MGKIISGIAAIFVFQIAFIWYMSSSTPENTSEIASVANTPQANRPETAEPVTVAESSVADEISSEEIGPESESRSTRNSNIRTSISRRSEERPVVSSAVRGKNAFRPRSIQIRERMPMATKVIYIPARESITARPRPQTEYRPKFTMELVDRPSGTISKVTREAARPKKRPLLARALPALVKKPWHWMKSLVAKLD